MPNEPTTTRGRRRLTIAGVTVVAMAAWLLSPRSLTSGGATVGMDMTVGDQLYIGDPGLARNDITVLAISSTASDGISVTFQLCHTPGRTDYAIGAVQDDLANYCRHTEPVRRGTRIEAHNNRSLPASYLIATITPTEPGPQWLCGYHILYRSGARLGWQRDLGYRVELNLPDEDDPDSARPCS